MGTISYPQISARAPPPPGAGSPPAVCPHPRVCLGLVPCNQHTWEKTRRGSGRTTEGPATQEVTEHLCKTSGCCSPRQERVPTGTGSPAVTCPSCAACLPEGQLLGLSVPVRVTRFGQAPVAQGTTLSSRGASGEKTFSLFPGSAISCKSAPTRAGARPHATARSRPPPRLGRTGPWLQARTPLRRGRPRNRTPDSHYFCDCYPSSRRH